MGLRGEAAGSCSVFDPASQDRRQAGLAVAASGGVAELIGGLTALLIAKFDMYSAHPCKAS